jgi:type I restriction enzyme M protein
MITGDMKNKIDGIWETFWTGGLSNPLSVIEQVTYLMFIKMLDDNQLKRESAANALKATVKNPVFKEGYWTNPEKKEKVAYKNLRWNVFKNLEAQEMFNLVRDDVFVFIKNIDEGKDTAFSKFMKNAIFLIPSPRVLLKVVDGISNLDLNNKDMMGDVYEYLLSKLASSGTNGQFRTPRHIIRMMVDLLKPTLNDTICDPAMGSGGFLVESAKYIEENNKDELYKKENIEKFNSNTFFGFDTDNTMLRIGAMNMTLHGVENPSIKYKDSLSDENIDREKYSMILANPPFKGSLDYETVAKDLLTITKTKKTELLFLSLFLRTLKVGGRAASIVPDGVLFGSSNAHKSIRKELIEKHKLEAIISMPSGVFKPYAGVSTAVLIFTKTNAGGTDKVWFYDMKADGYSLDDKRAVTKENDLPDIIARFSNLKAEEKRTKKDKSFLITKEELIANDYDLSINKYKEVEREEVVYEKPEVILNKVKTLQAEINLLLNQVEEKLGE